MPAAQPIARMRKEFPRLSAFTWSHPLWIALALTVFLTAVRSQSPVDSDVAWQLWIAGRIHAGARLYVDIIETNPPLWFWMAVPVERLAALLDARIDCILVASVGCLAALSLIATDRLILNISPLRRTLLLGYAALALVASPWMHVGQREQLVLIATLPYAALIAARSEGKAVDRRFAAFIGVAAALAFALKHYFLIAPAMLELWLIYGLRRQWSALRPEMLALLCVGAAYGTAILVFERDFLVRVLPIIWLAYSDFGTSSALDLFGPFALAGIAMVAMLGTQAQLLVSRSAPFASAMSVAALSFAAIYFIEFKGWPYHAIPLVGCASIALASILAETEVAPQWFRVLGPVLLALPLIFSEEEARADRENPDLMQALSGLPQGAPVGFLATENAIAWPTTLEEGYRYISRFDGFWMMRAIVLNEERANHDPRISALGRQVVSQTIDDFTCVPPQRIIISRPKPGQHDYDILPFFERDPRFLELMSHYRLRSRTTFETYDLASPLKRPTFACRKGI